MLRSALSAPKLMYTLRTSPCSDNPILTSFDALLRDGLCRIANVDISDLQWIQASLPIKDGGLGIRSVSTLAPSDFLASAAGTYELQFSILLRSNLTVTPAQGHSDTAVDETFSIWQARYDAEQPDGSEAGKQRAWDMASVKAGKDILWMSSIEVRLLHHLRNRLVFLTYCISYALVAQLDARWAHDLMVRSSILGTD